MFSAAWQIAAQEQRTAKAALHSLWRIEGQPSTIYLLGSVHLLKKENYPLPAAIESAFSNSQVAVFELDQDKMHEPAAQLKMMSKSRLPEGETLREHLSPETYSAFSDHVAKAGLPMSMFESLRPFMAVTILEMTELEKLGFDPEYGLDERLSARARKEGKEVVGLETVDFQIDLFTSFLKEDGEALMKAELKDIANIKRDFADIVDAWYSGNTAKLEKLLHEAMHDSPKLFKRMVTDRNQNWVPTIEAFARGNKNAIVIVGTGHLVGKEGVVELLKKRGLRVTQQ